MPDILGYLPDGTPTAAPQEAAAQQYKEGKLKFKQGERIPVKVRGVEGTLPSEDLDAALATGETELNFDPHGTAKATALGALSGATMGASDWMAIEGQKLYDPEGAEQTRQAMEGLRKEHGTAWSLGELGGTVLPMLVPGGGEAELLAGGARGAEEVANVSRTLGGVVESANATKAVTELASDSKAIADAHAASGTLKGSLLAKTFRALNPYEYVGQVGGLAQSAVSELLGGSKVIAPLTRFAVEGSIIGLASAVDESELGNTDLTGEAILASLEHGALWGTGLGLVGSGASRILTSAGRMADRMSEAQLGGSPLEMKWARKKHSPGALGNRYFEMGGTPFMDADQKYTLIAENHTKDGQDLERVVRDVDPTWGGVSAKEVREGAFTAMADKLEQYGVAGGDKKGMQELLRQDIDNGLEWKPEPERPPVIPERKAQELYEAAYKKAGLPDPEELVKPRRPTERDVRKLGQTYIHRFGLDLPLTREEFAARLTKEIQMAQSRGERPPPWVIGGKPEEFLEAEREQQREGLRIKARADLMGPYQQEFDKFEQINEAHNQLRNQAFARIQEVNAKLERRYQRQLAAVRAYNENLKVGFGQIRNVRIKIDQHIPWSYVHNADAVTNMAAELKHGVRSALESKVETEMDKLAAQSGQSELGRYVHAKTRYAQSADMLRMAERARARHAGLFSRPSRMGVSGAMMVGIAEAAAGHPFGGILLGVGTKAVQHYGPKVLAWSLHKAARIAQLKSLQQEVQIGMRRGIRKTFADGPAPSATAKVAIQDLPPAQARLTAAEAMEQVVRLGQNQLDLRSRLAALDPGLPLIAPKTFAATEGAFRRQVTWLIQQIPPRLLSQYQSDGAINPRDLTDAESRAFLEHSLATIDPRATTDALANGTLTTNMVMAHKAVWPNLTKAAMLDYKRQVAMDRDTFDFLPHSKKTSLNAVFGDDGDPAATLQFQMLASNLVNAPPAQGGRGGPKGMSHAAATSKGMAMNVQLLATQAQTAESGPPGRRGRSGRSAEANPGF